MAVEVPTHLGLCLLGFSSRPAASRPGPASDRMPSARSSSAIACIDFFMVVSSYLVVVVIRSRDGCRCRGDPVRGQRPALRGWLCPGGGADPGQRNECAVEDARSEE